MLAQLQRPSTMLTNLCVRLAVPSGKIDDFILLDYLIVAAAWWPNVNYSKIRERQAQQHWDVGC